MQKIIFLFFAFVCIHSEIIIHTVPEGCNYENCLLPIPIPNFEKIIEQKISFDENCLTYAKPGFECLTSWNKLFGKTRCMSTIHVNSDRFVWRKDPSSEGLIQLAAYSYDEAVKPYPDNPTLLKPFNTRVKPGDWYVYQIEFYEQSATMRLLDAVNRTLIEEQSIQHHHCNISSNLYYWGIKSNFYFGGHCKSPSRVTIEQEI